MLIAVDFDHTLHNPDDREPGYRMGKPYPGAKEALDEFRRLGATIVIHTCRARAPHGLPDPDPSLPYTSTVAHVADWLDYFEIPFDQITAMKPLADAYIDDKAVAFEGDWEHTKREALGMLYLGER